VFFKQQFVNRYKLEFSHLILFAEVTTVAWSLKRGTAVHCDLTR